MFAASMRSDLYVLPIAIMHWVLRLSALSRFETATRERDGRLSSPLRGAALKKKSH